MRISNVLYASLAIVLLFVYSAASASDREAEIIFEAERGNEPIPLLTEKYPDLTLDRAYKIQTDYVELKLVGDKVAGDRAGLTSKAVREKFGVSTSVSGVLFSSGKRASPASIDDSKYRRPVIETEIGYVVSKPISVKIPDKARLMEHIGAVMPVVEIPETGFADIQKLKAEDIVAANVGSAVFITGDEKPAATAGLDKIAVVLASGEETLSRGEGSDVTGGQLQALLGLVNSVIENGYVIERGSLLITGALGKVVPAAPGRYEARYAGLGDITFEIK
ncbi:MAG TPA: hypothetical protein VHC46_04945 [Thermodesulfobacteriota bacterium]|nr:hypothetical protein [Thermodesulfobacteriota bacterium]